MEEVKRIRKGCSTHVFDGQSLSNPSAPGSNTYRYRYGLLGGKACSKGYSVKYEIRKTELPNIRQSLLLNERVPEMA